MAGKYINKDELLEAYGDCIVTYCLQPKHRTFPTYGETGLWDYIERMPAADVAPVKHGHWINCKGSNGKDYRKCSECLHTQDITGLLNYCPICGAKMDGEENE